ncbi:transcription elongation factor GreA [Candidatus Gottesmanbacteria bacterium]|nr:transcription elongation factor GreA [Candidatus Gottesmanbacteria bacterium]
MSKYFSFTAEGFLKVKKEKDDLLIKRKTAVENLRTAREMGDLSENAAYKVARGELSSIDSRIRHLNKLILFGRVETVPTNGEIGIGSKITLMHGERKLEYEIVGSFESNPSNGKISSVSPLGKALIGEKEGKSVTIFTPNGQTNYQIIDVK